VAGGGLVETRCAAPLPLEGPARLRCVGGAAGAGRAWGGGRAAARVGSWESGSGVSGQWWDGPMGDGCLKQAWSLGVLVG